MAITWSTSREDMEVINKLVDRALELGVQRDRLDLTMDLSASHENCPLQLEELLKTENFDFLHDVYGIIRHLDRQTGDLKDCFVPRYAKR
jgi:hypothetical protein